MARPACSLIPRRISRTLPPFVPVALLTAFLLPVALLTTPPAAYAQYMSFGSTEGKSTLIHALPRLRWSTAENGPLLVVDPAHTYPLRKRDQPGPTTPLPDTGDRPLPVRTVTDHYDMKSFPVGTLTVFAPAEMTVFNSNPGKPDITADLRPDEKATRFFASLDKRQWGLLGSAQGIGMVDLNPRQRDLLLALLPEDTQVRPIMTRTSRGNSQEISNDTVTMRGTYNNIKYEVRGPWPNRFGTTIDPRVPPTTLTAAQRQSARLRVLRVPMARIGFTSDANAGLDFGPLRAPDMGGKFRMENRSNRRAGADGMAFGVKVKERVPNRPKAGHLNYEAPVLNRMIPLGGAATVADLLKRIGQACGLELMADKRVATLPVWVNEETVSAKAGDVLQALALSVTGTFRRIGPVYLLTEDVEGIGSRLGRLTRWSREAEQQANAEQQDFNERAQKEGYTETIGYDSASGMAMTDSILAAMKESSQKTPRSPFGRTTIPISALDSASQARVREMAAMVTSDSPLNLNEVQIEERMEVSFVLPGLGTIPIDNLGFRLDNLRQMARMNAGATVELPADRPVALPDTLKARVLVISAASLSDDATAAKWMTAAAKRGLTSLWIATDGVDTAPILRAIAAGKKAGVTVGALYSLMAAPADLAAERKDRNLFGETTVFGTDWRRPDTPETLAALRNRLNTLAAIPGLRALALNDMIPPGYQAPRRMGDGREDAFPISIMLGDEAESLGYTPEARLAFLRKEGVDPIDLSPSGRMGGVRNVNLLLPFFSDDRFLPVPPVDEKANVMFLVDGENLIPARRNFSGAEFSGEGGRARPVRPSEPGNEYALKWRQMRVETQTRFLTDLYTALHQKPLPIPIYFCGQGPTMRTFDIFTWFGTWDKADGLPRETFGMAPDVLARQVSKTILYALPSRPHTDKDPTYLRNYTLAQNTSIGVKTAESKFDGFVLDLSRMPAGEQMGLLESAIAVKP
jgi:hypothetical protein